MPKVRRRCAPLAFFVTLAMACVAPAPIPSVTALPAASSTPSTSAPRSPAPIATQTPTTPPSPVASLSPESAVDISRWTALDWSQGTVESPERRQRVAVRDVMRWGEGFIAVGYVEDWSTDPPARALTWLSDDGVSWRLTSDDSATFAGMEPCCVMRARDALVVWTRHRGSFLSSRDGLTWTRTEHNGGGEQFVVTPTSDGLFGLAAPFDGRVWTTTDGVSWHASQTTGLDLKAFGRGSLGLLATDFGYLLAAEATRGGVFDGCGLWANWYSPDGLTWEEFTLKAGRLYVEGARNASRFFQDHELVYAAERPSCGFSFDWTAQPVWRSADGVKWEIAQGSFAEQGLFDGQFTLDLSTYSDRNAVRLSADGVTFLELDATGPEGRPPYDGWPSAVGSQGIVVFKSDSGPNPSVWLGRGVVDEQPSTKPAVYCGAIDPAICLYLVREVASERTSDGTAFVAWDLCTPAWMDCQESHFVVVEVPPMWPDAGKLTRWLYDEGEVSRFSGAGWAENVRNRLSHDGPWTDALVADQLWVRFRRIDVATVDQAMSDIGLLAVSVKPVGDVLWYAVGIEGRWPAATKLAELRRDPRICAANFIRFDPFVLKGGGEATPLAPPDATDCG